MKKLSEAMNTMDKKEKRKIYIIAIALIGIFIASAVGLTYAWFSITVTGNDTAKGVIVETGELSIKYTNGNEIRGEYILPGWNVSKTFTVENTGDVPATFNINWENLTNEFTYKNDLTYNLTSATSGDILVDTPVPSSGTHLSIANNLNINAGDMQAFTLTIHYKNRNENQNSDMGKNLIGKIEVRDVHDTY